MAATKTVLDFWFGSDPTNLLEIERRYKRWFAVDPGFDNEIAQRFGASVVALGADEETRAYQDAHDALASILLLDQFPRNIYRGSAKAFQFDAKSLAICRAGIEKKDDLLLSTIERVFFYLPLEHAEDLTAQRMSVMQFENLLHSSNGEFRDILNKNLEYARQHLDLIDNFGRFPHRNAALGRPTTKAETAFLATEDRRFGQA